MLRGTLEGSGRFGEQLAGVLVRLEVVGARIAAVGGTLLLVGERLAMVGGGLSGGSGNKIVVVA